MRDCLLSFGTEFLSSSLLSKILRLRYIWNNNFACRFVWVLNLVAHIDGGTKAEGV